MVLCSGSYHYEFSTNFQTSKHIILTNNKLMIDLQIISFKNHHLHPLSWVPKVLLILKKSSPLMTFSRDFMFRVVHLLVYKQFSNFQAHDACKQWVNNLSTNFQNQKASSSSSFIIFKNFAHFEAVINLNMVLCSGSYHYVF